MDKFGEIIVNYIMPFSKGFGIFLAVMFVLSFFAKAKEGKLIDMAETIFVGSIKYTGLAFYGVFVSIVWVFKSIGRVCRVIFATVRDFFVSRI